MVMIINTIINAIVIVININVVFIITNTITITCYIASILDQSTWT